MHPRFMTYMKINISAGFNAAQRTLRQKYNKVIDYLLSQLIPYYEAIHLELTVHYG